MKFRTYNMQQKSTKKIKRIYIKVENLNLRFGVNQFYLGKLKKSIDSDKEIQNIQVGDKVFAKNEYTGETGYKEVKRLFVNTTDILVHLDVADRKIDTTVTHPFWVEEKGWVSAGCLNIGDVVTLANGEKAEITNVTVEKLVDPVKVYNFEVEDYHTYYVTDIGVLVHNMCAKKITKGVRQADNIPGRGYHKEVYANKPVKVTEAVDKWDEFLGPGEYTDIHPRTGLKDPDRIFSADGKRSIRFGSHEMNSKPSKIHYHEEIWTNDPINNVMNVDNTVVRVPYKNQE